MFVLLSPFLQFHFLVSWARGVISCNCCLPLHREGATSQSATCICPALLVQQEISAPSLFIISFQKEETSAASSSFFLFLFKSKLFLLITCTVWSAQCTGLFLHVPVWTAQKQTNNPHNMIWFDQMYKAISFVESESFNKTNVKILHFHICAESKKYLFLCLGADYDKSLQFLAPQVL